MPKTLNAAKPVKSAKVAKAAKAAKAAESNLSLFDYSSYVDEIICGVDEAGRGPLAGPVFAAAVILDPARPIEGLRDSKKLSEASRDSLAMLIKSHALAWAISSCSEQEIDELNILQASMLAMRRAVEALQTVPTLALIDGNRCPVMAIRSEAIVKGDDKVAAISAASILAKTARDAALHELHAIYPHYAFDQHKGYPTALHLERLQLHGVSPVHRRSYAPVRALLEVATPPAFLVAAQQPAQPGSLSVAMEFGE
ncbi:ribonuclease HII [Herbaspirillum lusitanum]|jgi:ribonuclease HII|uniref:Ribonuclease HII n=1 Tax=Herbaspirillum lusitanum TaxID=213312 RepID=A0ABW9A8A2_9BURK